MENSQQPLAIESFSYSWLSSDMNSHSSSSSSSSSSDHGYVDNLCKEHNNNFDFDIHFSTSPKNLAHADEIFSDGHIKPVFPDRSSSKENIMGLIRRVSISVPSSPLNCPPYILDARKNQYYDETGKWKRIIKKCFQFVKRPLCNTFGRCSRKSNKVDDLERKVCEAHDQSWRDLVGTSPRVRSDYNNYSVHEINKIDKRVHLSYGLKRIKSWSSSSPQASPRIFTPSHHSCSNNPWSSDAEISIHEAILYCKRSIEK